MPKMTSYERMITALNKEVPDRVPVAPILTVTHPAKRLGLSIPDVVTDAKKFADMMIKLWEFYKSDWARIDCINFIPKYEVVKRNGRELLVRYLNNFKWIGGLVRVFEDDSPALVEPSIKKAEDIESWEPPDPYEDGSLAAHQEVVKRVVSVLGDDVFVCGYDYAPFELACGLRGVSNFLLDLYDNPKLATKLLDKSFDIALTWGKGLVEAGVHGLKISDSFCSNNIISPRDYTKWALPYEQKLFAELKKAGTKIILHIEISDLIIGEMAKSKADALSVDSPVDLKKAREMVGQQVCLMGNVAPVDTIFKGTPKDVEKEAVECIKKAGRNGAYILASGCGIPRDAPPENIKALVNAARKYGRYPLEGL